MKGLLQKYVKLHKKIHDKKNVYEFIEEQYKLEGNQ